MATLSLKTHHVEAKPHRFLRLRGGIVAGTRDQRPAGPLENHPAAISMLLGRQHRLRAPAGINRLLLD